MDRLYCERYYEDEELAFVQDTYGIVLEKEVIDAANKFFSVFYMIETTYCKIHRYDGYALDVFPTDNSMPMEELAKFYTGTDLPKDCVVHPGMSFDEVLAHIEPKFWPDERATLISNFKKIFDIAADEEPVSVLETGCFDSVHSYQFYILCGLWIVRFKNVTLFVTLGSDE